MGQCGAFLQILVGMVHFGKGGGLSPPPLPPLLPPLKQCRGLDPSTTLHPPPPFKISFLLEEIFGFWWVGGLASVGRSARAAVCGFGPRS